jgi:hypothetical protein
MLSADDHPGIFMFLVGMIVIVMAAVGLSIVADKYQSSSRGGAEIHREISANATEISGLSARTDEKSRLLADSGSQLLAAEKTHEEFSARLESTRQRQAMLEVAGNQLRAAIATLEEDFARYRTDYRRKTWAGAVGESLGTLTIRDGRDYQDATITRVTDVGLEIRHKDGIARIQAPDLGHELQDRFQWSDEERRTRLKEELELHDPEPAEHAGEDSKTPEVAGATVPPVINRQPAIDAAEKAEKLRQARQQVIGWRGKVALLRGESRIASSRASYGSQTSVPGSLETWSAKAARLGRELAHAQAGLAIAKSKLAEISPGDSVLREPRREY